MPPNRRQPNELRTPNSRANFLARSRIFAGEVRRNAQVLAKKGINVARTVSKRGRELISPGKIEENLQRAEMRRAARERYAEERRLRNLYRIELKQINEELRNIIKLIKQQQGIRGNLTIENSLVLERVAMNLFKARGNSEKFVLERNPANKQAIVKILLFTERELNKRKLTPKIASKDPLASERVENIINENISRVFEELNQQQ